MPLREPRAVRATGLRKRYGRRHGFVDALLGIDLEVSIGEVIGLLGPNGAGKTTLMEILEGIRMPDSGDAEIFGVPVRDAKRMKSVRRRIGISLQHTVLPDMLTVAELLRLQADLFGSRARVDSIIDRLGLTEKQASRIGRLSGGQQQRAAVAMALVGDPELLFLDEPTSQLDPHARRSVWSVLESQRARRAATILLSTHQMEEAQRLCDRVVIMNEGQIVAAGSPSDLIEQHCPARRVVLTVARDANLDFAGTGMVCEPLPDGLLRVSTTPPDLGRFLAGLSSILAGSLGELRTLQVEQPTLEDVFIKLTGSQEFAR